MQKKFSLTLFHKGDTDLTVFLDQDPAFPGVSSEGKHLLDRKHGIADLASINRQ